MKHILSSLAVATLLHLSSAGITLAANPHGPGNPTGQPGQTCGVTTGPATPGNTMNAGGSPFNPGGVSGAVYAGAMGSASAANAQSPHAVSQYDVACFQLP